ncbi:MAG: adenine deaminase [bacterium]
MNSLKDRIAVARGEKKANLVLKNGQLINVFSNEVYPADVAIHKDRVAGIGNYVGEKEIDLNGRYIAPGFIDSHIHIESTMLTPCELAKATVAHGTTAIICDPYGIANVLGVKGIKYLLEASEHLPLDFFFTVPSCVPASPFETSGAKISTEEMTSLLKNRRVLKLGEMMSYPEVLAGKKEILDKIEIACQVGIEGHAPGLTGPNLNAYVAAGMSSDHESISAEEANEKLKAGLQILVREGSSAQNLAAILPLITAADDRFFCFCTDDICPADLAKGHMNTIIKKAVALKLDPILAIRLASLNVARYYQLKDYGVVAPGYYADINILSNLEDFTVDMVFKRGKQVANKGHAQFEFKSKKLKQVRDSINIKSFELEDLQITAKSDYALGIELVPHQNITKAIVVPAKTKGKTVTSDIESDILKLVVVERHKASGNIGLGLVKGFGIKCGALATSVAHDAHNIVCVGVDDEDIVSAVRRVAQLGGGMVAVKGGLVLAELALPIAGLMSDQALDKVLEHQKKLDKAVADLDCKVDQPFGVLSYLTLPVIPELRLTDLGLVDVVKSKIVDLFE